MFQFPNVSFFIVAYFEIRGPVNSKESLNLSSPVFLALYAEIDEICGALC